MKAVVYSPAALARFADLLGCTLERFGAARADVHAVRLAGRLEAPASGHGPKARPRERLMRGVREASGLTCFREGSHYPIVREKPQALEVVEIFHFLPTSDDIHNGRAGLICILVAVKHGLETES